MPIWSELSGQKTAVIFIALAVNILTMICKKPLKRAAESYEQRTGRDKGHISRYVTLLPLGLSMLISAGYVGIVSGPNPQLITETGLSAYAAALALYALYEQFLAKKDLGERTQKIYQELKSLDPAPGTGELETPGEKFRRSAEPGEELKKLLSGLTGEKAESAAQKISEMLANQQEQEYFEKD